MPKSLTLIAVWELPSEQYQAYLEEYPELIVRAKSFTDVIQMLILKATQAGVLLAEDEVNLPVTIRLQSDQQQTAHAFMNQGQRDQP